MQTELGYALEMNVLLTYRRPILIQLDSSWVARVLIARNAQPSQTDVRRERNVEQQLCVRIRLDEFRA